ncbi:MAG: BamA/TamA family outer membrane protein [Acidobacteria bacterium]|nr:BamA/TamA family outer membrane protein [Acidobacteriota bacterium]
MLNIRVLAHSIVLGVFLFPAGAIAQTGATAQPQQAPKTAPQVQNALPAYNGQNVTSVELAGQPGADLAALEPLLAQKAGEPFSEEKVNQSLAALKQAGKFQAVEVEFRPEAGGVRVLFVLQPAVYFGMFEFPGAQGHFPYSRLVQVANYPPQGAYTPVDVENAQKSLQRFFQRNGYFEAQVTPQLNVDAVHGLANVTFQTRLGRHAKFGAVSITGTNPQETQHLEAVLHSTMARLHTAAIRPGKTYKLATIQKATQYLENRLMKEGMLGGQVKLIGANYNPETNRADIQYQVNTGPAVNVKVEGAHLWPWTRKNLLPVYQMNGLDPELIQEGRQNLISHFQDKGYFDDKVTVTTTQQSNGETIVYQITKGPRHKVAGVDITGNQHLDGKDLMGHVTVEKGHLLSHGKYSEKLVRASASNLKKVYQANGYSTVQVTPGVTSQPNGNVVVTFRVNEGPRDVVEDFAVEGNNTVPLNQLAPQGLKLGDGKPYSTKLVDDDRTQIVANYLRMGYLTATFRETAKPIGKDKHRLRVVYQIYEGPKVITAQVVTLGRKVTRQALINRVTALRSEQPMRMDNMLRAENDLYNLGIFDWAEIDPRRSITTQTQEDEVVKVHEAQRNAINYGFGFEVVNRGGSLPSGTVAVPGIPPIGLPHTFKTSEKTFWGPRGSFEYTRLNLWGRSESITVGGLAGRLDQRFQAGYNDPFWRNTNWSSGISISGERDSQNPIFTSRMAQGQWQLQRALNAKRTNTLFLRYSFSETGISNLLIPQLIPASDLHTRLSTVAASFVRDTRDNPLDAHKGVYDTAEIDVNPQVLGSNVSFARLLTQTAYYRKTWANIVWANSLRVGFARAFSGSHVPISQAFFSGGGSTLRGFPLNGAGPQHTITACGTPGDVSTCAPITVPVGGRELVILNSELRIPSPIDLPFVDKKLSFVPFYDGGNVFRAIGFSNFWPTYTNSVGFGLRYATPVGPVRVDIGHNLNPLPGIKSTQIFVTLGQAF